MKFNIELTISNSEGALERVLGRLRQRSFSLCSIWASTNQAVIEARIIIEGTRPIEPALKQLDKLYDVLRVEVKPMEGTVSHVYAQNDASSRLGLCASL